MNQLRSLLKFACRAILAVGFAAATLILIAAGMAATDLPYKFTMALFYAAGIVAAAVFIAGALGLLISIDERLERLLEQSGGK